MANIDAMKILGSLLSSGALSRGSGGNVLGSVIGAMTGGGRQAGASTTGGLGDLVGSVLGGGRSGGGMGDLLGGLLGGGSSAGGGGLGSLIGMAMQQFGAGSQGGAVQAQAHASSPHVASAGVGRTDAEQQATLLIKAMINAAKADGKIDSGEQQRIVERLGDVTADEVAFVQREFQRPLDVAGFVREIPRGMEQHVYIMSLMAIDLDSNPEAQYLHQLAQASGLDAGTVNQIHDKLGAPRIYR